MSAQNKNIITELSTVANWYELLILAKEGQQWPFDEALEHYLIMTLEHLKPESYDFDRIIAIDYLKAVEQLEHDGYQPLRQIGDQCLITTGLFPELGLQKNLSLSYYSSIGQQAYSIIGQLQQPELDNSLFLALSQHFLGLSDLLYTMRQIKQPS